MRIKKYITALGFHSTKLDKKKNCQKGIDKVFVSYKNLAEAKIENLENELQKYRDTNSKMSGAYKEAHRYIKELEEKNNLLNELQKLDKDRIWFLEKSQELLEKENDVLQKRKWAWIFTSIIFLILLLAVSLW